ncbi:dihydrofolate reductase family protein [Actinomadura sp. HBU206391]|uniref:dihydrofolate reductase family protein n=1 Tax=Actinomadura sp. HBU206391 TaxID=2731692 RepID=UPI00164F1B29|nr:dihydrofolate reductase family protein [Actinomadura sp. HBU206391]MBC6458511.1 dihydrofolate reductase [Actinomadura sp. HBU206391]
MGRIVANIFLTLDGVMQDPGGPEEDAHDGSELSGWSTPYQDQVMGEAMGKGMAGGGVMLLGRKTYEHLATYWPHQPDDNPYAAVLNNRQKYVVSRTLREPLPWRNSTLIDGDVPGAVTELREQHDKDIAVLGSGELVRSLIPHRLIDVCVLLIHPVVLGKGQRLFTGDGTFAAFRLVDSTTTTTGVIIATYQPDVSK